MRHHPEPPRPDFFTPAQRGVLSLLACVAGWIIAARIAAHLVSLALSALGA